MVNAAAFRATLARDAPPQDISEPLAALWWAAKGDWDKAHMIVQDDESRDAAWVHAYLHRVEGDLPNAHYWYSQAGRPVRSGALEDEWAAIAAVLLSQPVGRASPPLGRGARPESGIELSQTREVGMDTRATVMELYAAYRAGDADRVSALIGENIDWVIHGPAHVFSFEGPRRGKAAALEALAEIAEAFELKRHEPELIIVEGERAAVIANTSFVQRSTGRTLSMRLVNFIRVRDGKIVEFREFSDTFDAVEQAVGAPLIVPALPA